MPAVYVKKIIVARVVSRLMLSVHVQVVIDPFANMHTFTCVSETGIVLWHSTGKLPCVLYRW